MEGFFQPRPRPKKSLLPPSKKRKTHFAIEEINFDSNARADYLTGFHKRKVVRAQRAQEEASKKARQERIETRKQVSHFEDIFAGLTLAASRRATEGVGGSC